MDQAANYDGDTGVEHLEFIVGADRPQTRGPKRLAQPEVRVSLDLLPDGRVIDRSWSFAVAYEIPHDRRETAGADAISLLWDENGWHVRAINFDEDPESADNPDDPDDPVDSGDQGEPRAR